MTSLPWLHGPNRKVRLTTQASLGRAAAGKPPGTRTEQPINLGDLQEAGSLRAEVSGERRRAHPSRRPPIPPGSEPRPLPQAPPSRSSVSGCAPMDVHCVLLADLAAVLEPGWPGALMPAGRPRDLQVGVGISQPSAAACHRLSKVVATPGPRRAQS